MLFFGNLHTLSLQGMQNISGFLTESILRLLQPYCRARIHWLVRCYPPHAFSRDMYFKSLLVLNLLEGENINQIRNKMLLFQSLWQRANFNLLVSSRGSNCNRCDRRTFAIRTGSKSDLYVLLKGQVTRGSWTTIQTVQLSSSVGQDWKIETTIRTTQCGSQVGISPIYSPFWYQKFIRQKDYL